MDLTIAMTPCDFPESCAACGKRVPAPTGPHLALAGTCEPVCRDCGKRHAPALAALLDLAHVARRVGRIGRHTLVPPMNALLDLARAAEHYTEAVPRERRPTAA
jgi:hypothetical protein